MNFKIWLEGLEEYEPFKSKIENTYRKFAFSHLFSNADKNGRIFIPFSSEEISQEDEKTIKELSETLQENGYEIVDIKSGYARLKNKKNLIKIGKLLDTLKYKDHKKNQENFNSEIISELKYKNEKKLIESYYNDLKRDFENMNYRVGSEFEIAISMNIHDIASMSTGRGWTSCMNLKGGAHKKDVYCEVGYGGFVAYLIRKGDKEIKNPLSRIHIRRFDNKSGRSIALPEETVYGVDKEGFLIAVRSWLEKTQGVVQAGPYKRMGGSYSDTFGNRRHFIRPSDNNQIMEWINKWIGMNKNKKAKYWQYFANAMSSLIKGGSYPEEFLIKVRDYIFGERNSNVAEFGNLLFKGGSLPVKNGWNQDANQFIPSFTIKFPKIITKDHFIHAFTYAANHNNQYSLIDKLVETYPQYADKDILKATKVDNIRSKIIGKVKDSYILSILEDEFMNNMTINNNKFNARSVGSPYEILHNIRTEMDKLTNFNPIPEKLVVKLLDFVEKRNDLNIIDKEQNKYLNYLMKRDQQQAIDDAQNEVRNSILKHAIHVLSITKTDIPLVQKFYKNLLDNWEKSGGIGVLGRGISSLKENGRSFIPFIKEKRNKIEKMQYKPEMKNLKIMNEEIFNELKEKTLESFDYVLDTLEKGESSKKYIFHYSEMLDTYNFDAIL